MKEYIIASNRAFSGSIVSNPEELEKVLKDRNDIEIIFFPFWSWKVSFDILSKYGCIGFHSAPLPYGQGGSPIQNMIRLGYKTTILCMFYMTNAFDGGDILSSREVSLTGSLSDIISGISSGIKGMISNYVEGTTISHGSNTDYGLVPMKFDRITENYLPEKDTLDKVYDEIRMRDEDGHPKAYVYLGKWRIEFSKADFKDGYVTANAKIFQG